MNRHDRTKQTSFPSNSRLEKLFLNNMSSQGCVLGNHQRQRKNLRRNAVLRLSNNNTLYSTKSNPVPVGPSTLFSTEWPLAGRGHSETVPQWSQLLVPMSVSLPPTECGQDTWLVLAYSTEMECHFHDHLMWEGSFHLASRFSPLLLWWSKFPGWGGPVAHSQTTENSLQPAVMWVSLEAILSQLR